MGASSVLLVCILVTCAVWTVQGRSVKLKSDDLEDVELSVEAGRLPGVCWLCKWALNKVKKAIGPNATAESIKAKLLPICDRAGLLKSMCQKFVKGHLAVLIEELSTTDDVRTICVVTKACKKKDILDEFFYQSEEDLQIELNEYH